MEVVYNNAIEDAVVVEEQPAQEPTVTATDQEPVLDYRTFDFGNLMLACGRCGHIETLELGVEGGIQVILPTTDKHRLEMTCPKCKNFIKLYFTENFTKTKEVKNEATTTDKEKESEPGVSEDNK